MKLLSQFRSAAGPTGVLFGLLGLLLLAGGIRLAVLGGSIFYATVGAATLVSGLLLVVRRRVALYLFTLVLLCTTAWSVYEIGFD